MARPPRPSSSSELLTTSYTLLRSSNRYCRQCRNTFQLKPSRAFSASLRTRSSEPFSEKLRRKLWRTEPPGRIDPYSPSSPFRDPEETRAEAGKIGVTPSMLVSEQEQPERSSEAQAQAQAEAEAEAQVQAQATLRQQLQERRQKLSKLADGQGGVAHDELKALLRQDVQAATTGAGNEGAYEPAETWDGLEWVGLKRSRVIKRERAKERKKAAVKEPKWGVPVQKEDTYPFTWTTPDQSSAPEKIEAALHRSLVEIFTLLSEGRSPLDASKASNKNATDWTVAVRIDPSEDKESAVLSFSSVEIRERVLEVMTAKARKDGKKKGLTGAMEEVAQETEAEAEAEAGEEDVAEDAVRTEAEASGEVKSEAVEAAVEDNRSIEKDASIAAESEIELYDKYNPEVEDPDEGDTTEAQDQTTPPENKSKAVEPVPWGERWMSISISDPIIKFALLKRFTQITGLRVPDSAVRTARTAHDVFAATVDSVREKPKLAEILLTRTELPSIPNVLVVDKKVTRKDRDVELGRYGPIMAELKRRGLDDLRRERGRGM